MAYLKWILPTTLLYLMLTGNFEPLNWGLGLFVALAVVALLRPEPTPIRWSHLPQAAIGTMLFIAKLLKELLVTGIQVAQLVLQKEPNIQQGIVAIPDATNEAWVTTVSAEAITLTPGEMVVEIGPDGTLYTHTLDVNATVKNSLAQQKNRASQLEGISL